MNSREEVANRLKEKEEAINSRIEALQDELLQTRKEVESYVKDNPWIGVIGSIIAGVGVGLILGKKSQKAIHKELVNSYVNQLADVARRAGASEFEVGEVLREALRETQPPIVYAVPDRAAKKGLFSSLFGVATSVALNYGSKYALAAIDKQLAKADADNSVED